MTPQAKKTTIDDRAIRDLPGVLDLAAFELAGDRMFEPIGALPSWFPPLREPLIDLAEHFPMLEMFLPEFQTAWNGGSPVTSDLWTEAAPAGGDLYLQATATAVGGRRFLVIKSLPPALYTYQQLAHDFELAEEQVRKLKVEAERANRSKSDFLAMMSHEIRTPLNAVIGLADVLSGTPLTPEQQKCVDVTQRNGMALLRLINDILDLSKVESGKVELERTEMDLREVVDRALEVVEGKASAKGLTLTKTIEPGVPLYLIGDPNRLRQIIINLLGNSIKFTETGGLKVNISRDPEQGSPGSLLFAVKDTGIGIPADKLSSVFESFTQADTSTTRKYGGTGLGLTISRQLVELMGGRIWVESTPDVGSVFYFTARFGVQEDQTERGAEPDAGPKASLEDLENRAAGLHILLADDSEDNRFLILSYLKKTGSHIDIAENGEMALELFRSRIYDVVLMDVEMPVMDGYTATRAIRAFETSGRSCATPVLALTAHAFAEMAARASETGFTELLTKPIRKQTLLEALIRHTSADPRPHTEHAQPGPLPNVWPAHLQRDVIQVEEGMEEAVPIYLEKRRADVAVYREALRDGHFQTICSMAHKMKGTGGGYGLPRLTALAGALERAAKAGDATEAGNLVSEFARYLDSVDLKYSKKL